MRLPEYPRPGSKQPVEQSIKQIIDYLRAITLTSVNGGKLRQSTSGTTISIIQRQTSSQRTPSPICPFGEIIPYDDLDFTHALRGGIVYCGDKNFIVPIQGLNLEADGEWLVYLKLQCEANRDDDEEIFLPGIKTSPETMPFDFWQRDAYTFGDDYPDNFQPLIETGLGQIIIPIGHLTIADGSARLEPVACGNVTINQCAGILSHTRG